MGQIEYKGIFINELKSETGNDGRFYISGYASTFGNEDSYKDVVDPGAFMKTLSENRNRIRFCKDHDLTKVIGKIIPESLAEDNIGLAFTCRMGRSAEAKDAIMQIEDGELDEISIGYIPVKYYYDGDIRHLTEIELIEVSLVSRAANPQAVITSSQRKSELLLESLATCSDDELLLMRDRINGEYYKRIFNHLK